MPESEQDFNSAVAYSNFRKQFERDYPELLTGTREDEEIIAMAFANRQQALKTHFGLK